ncbi:hypothetical protein ACPZ19_50545, partial [Amycolatopsis lurida]
MTSTSLTAKQKQPRDVMPSPARTRASARSRIHAKVDAQLVPEDELSALWFDLSRTVLEMADYFSIAQSTLYAYVRKYDLPPRRFLLYSGRGILQTACVESPQSLDKAAEGLGISRRALEKALSFHNFGPEWIQAVSTAAAERLTDPSIGPQDRP